MHDTDAEPDARAWPPPLALRHLATGLFALLGVLGVWICWTAVGYGVGSISSPGAGAWPLVIGLSFVALSGWLLVVRDAESEQGAVSLRAPLALWLITLIWAVALQYLTFIAVSSVALFLVFKWIGRASWVLSIAVPIVVSTAIYYVFAHLLAVPLP